MTSPEQAVSSNIGQATLWEKLDIFQGLLSLVGAALYAAVTGPFRGNAGAYKYRQHVTHALLRKLTSRFSTAQLQYIGEPFGKAYEKWCKAHSIPPEFVTLKSGCKTFWLGDHKTAKYIVIYYHGGGFSLDGDVSHLDFWRSVTNDLASNNTSAAFLFVEYTLVPHGTYPTQIREGVESLQYVLEDLGRSPADVLLAGDSAGGNMALAVLSHISHPLPELPALKFDHEKRLKALVLIAPWVSFAPVNPSCMENKGKDIMTESMAIKWGQDYLSGKPSSVYAEALTAPAEWWKDAKVEQLLTVAGGDELLVDAISQWVEKFKSVNPETITYFIAPHEGHIAPILEPLLGDTEETEQGKAIKSWLKARL